MQNTNFDDVVKMIEESNKKVDEVLKAARLGRYERQPMPKDRLEMLLGYAVGALALILFSAGVYMVIYYCNH